MGERRRLGFEQGRFRRDRNRVGDLAQLEPHVGPYAILGMQRDPLPDGLFESGAFDVNIVRANTQGTDGVGPRIGCLGHPGLVRITIDYDDPCAGNGSAGNVRDYPCNHAHVLLPQSNSRGQQKPKNCRKLSHVPPPDPDGIPGKSIWTPLYVKTCSGSSLLFCMFLGDSCLRADRQLITLGSVKRAILLVALTLSFVTLPSPAEQTRKYVCLIDPQVSSEEPGSCVVCGYELIAADLAASGYIAFSCAEHREIQQSIPGKCPTCGRN